PEPHTYCRDCLVGLFRSSITNTELFPPRCCKVPISLDVCHALLPKVLIKDFDLKVEELATINPKYCSSSSCAKFLRLEDIKSGIGTCHFCMQKTCVTCKEKQHSGLCPDDPHVGALMGLAERLKWQRCTNCKNMVELSMGCFHMICKCKHEFCYVCGVKWK
ncbi:hypothetical protein CC78DRAFT_410341, partial [Lojkania enalia]